MTHPHQFLTALVDQRHRCENRRIEAAAFRQLLQIEPVDEIDDLQMAREQPAQQRHRPGLERFRQQGVVRVVQCRGADAPSILPRELVLVDEDAHELRNGDRSMGLVELDGRLIRE